MTDILIRGLSDEILQAIDAQARSLGLSRSEYLRRTLEREHTHAGAPITVDGLSRMAALADDLNDPEVMDGAWS